MRSKHIHDAAFGLSCNTVHAALTLLALHVNAACMVLHDSPIDIIGVLNQAAHPSEPQPGPTIPKHIPHRHHKPIGQFNLGHYITMRTTCSIENTMKTTTVHLDTALLEHGHVCHLCVSENALAPSRKLVPLVTIAWNKNDGYFYRSRGHA